MEKQFCLFRRELQALQVPDFKEEESVVAFGFGPVGEAVFDEVVGFFDLLI